jgi:ABC-type nitrate/sulfonate/bicarbonate transport system permease component
MAALPRSVRRSSGFLLVALLLCLWEVSARFGAVTSENWVPLSRVLVAFAAGIRSGELPLLLLATLYHSLAGFIVGSAVGVAVGLMMAGYRRVDSLLEPLVELCRPIPIPAILPPLILVLGIGDALKIFVVAFSAFFPVAINTIYGVAAVPPAIRDMARTFQRSRRDVLLRIVLPSALPYVTAGMRVALALSLVVAIAAEMIAGSAGLGHYMVTMLYAMRPEDMYAAILLLAVAGYSLNLLFVVLERHLVPWFYAQAV